MPPKNSKKTADDEESPNIEIVETISSFEKQIMKKMDKMQGTLKEISENVSKLSKIISTSKENTSAKEIVSETSNTSNEILKEMASTLKEILRAKETTTNSQPVVIQESTQILIEHEAEKLKQTMIQTWNTKLRKRAAEFWQMIRNENTAKVYETWKNNSPSIIPRKFQMKEINEEPLTQTKLREKQAMLNFETEIELMKLRAESHQERYQKIDTEMGELINKKYSGQKQEMLRKLWRDECVSEEIRSQERWENSNVKWCEKYETAFVKFFETKKHTKVVSFHRLSGTGMTSLIHLSPLLKCLMTVCPSSLHSCVQGTNLSPIRTPW